MRRLKQPDLWFLLAVLLVTAGGAILLSHSDATWPDAQHLSYCRHHWQAAFDALSAACGVGLLTYSFEEDYTPRGRWILTALGVLGALLFLAAATHALRRMQSADADPRVAHPLFVVAAFLVLQTLVVGIFLLVQRVGGSEAATAQTAWRAIAAFSSLGWASESQQGLEAWPLVLLAWLGALGWPLWLLIVPPLTKRYVPVRAALAVFGAYTVSLLLAALVVSAFESPRGAQGSIHRRDADATQAPALRAELRGYPSGQRWSMRYARSLVQTVAASGAGMPTEPLAGRDATVGTKVTLSALLVVGGLGGSATGGVQWPLLLWALAGGAAALGWPRRAEPAPDPSAGLGAGSTRWMHAGLACVFLLALLAFVVALGLLLIENWTASRFQAPPTFADALLDACSAVAGGNLSSGLTESVTSRNLHSGIRQPADLYQYGMAWLMLAMLTGRVLPLVVLRRLADTRPSTFTGETPVPPRLEGPACRT